VRAQLFVRAQVRAFRQEPHIHFTEHRREAIGIVNLMPLTIPLNGQAVIQTGSAIRQRAGKKTALIHSRQFADIAPLLTHKHTRRIRQKSAHRLMAAFLVQAEQRKRVGVAAGAEGINGLGIHRGDPFKKLTKSMTQAAGQAERHIPCAPARTRR